MSGLPVHPTCLCLLSSFPLLLLFVFLLLRFGQLEQSGGELGLLLGPLSLGGGGGGRGEGVEVFAHLLGSNTEERFFDRGRGRELM